MTIKTVSTDITLAALGLQGGDAFIVDAIEDGKATLSLARQPSRAMHRRSTKEFLKKWSGRFPLPSTRHDDRVNAIASKHVK